MTANKSDMKFLSSDEFMQRHGISPAEYKKITCVSKNFENKILPPSEIRDTEVPPVKEFVGSTKANIVEKKLDVDLTEEKIVYRPVKQVLKRPVEVVKTVEKVIKKQVIKTIEVPVDTIKEVEVPYEVEKVVYVPDFDDKKVPYCVSQVNVPKLTLAEAKIECAIYEPNVKFVDVYIPKVVNNCIELKSTETKHIPLEKVSKAQWNTIVMRLNTKLCSEGDLDYLPLHLDGDYAIAFKPEESVGCVLNENSK